MISVQTAASQLLIPGCVLVAYIVLELGLACVVTVLLLALASFWHRKPRECEPSGGRNMRTLRRIWCQLVHRNEWIRVGVYGLPEKTHYKLCLACGRYWNEEVS